MRTQPVIAYRIWKVSPEGRLSTAYRNSGKWPWMKPYSAACDGGSNWTWMGYPVNLIRFGESPPTDHDAPHFDCTCGLYGYKSVKCLEQTFEQYYKGNAVLGRVALWGRVVEHVDGYRAEYGYPQVLYCDYGAQRENVVAAARKYGIDTAPLPEEIMTAYSQFVEKKRLEEETQRQMREAQEKIQGIKHGWISIDEIKYILPPDDWSKVWSKKNDDTLKKAEPKPYTDTSFLTDVWKGNF